MWPTYVGFTQKETNTATVIVYSAKYPVRSFTLKNTRPEINVEKLACLQHTKFCGALYFGMACGESSWLLPVANVAGGMSALYSGFLKQVNC